MILCNIKMERLMRFSKHYRILAKILVTKNDCQKIFLLKSVELGHYPIKILKANRLLKFLLTDWLIGVEHQL